MLAQILSDDSDNSDHGTPSAGAGRKRWIAPVAGAAAAAAIAGTFLAINLARSDDGPVGSPSGVPAGSGVTTAHPTSQPGVTTTTLLPTTTSPTTGTSAPKTLALQGVVLKTTPLTAAQRGKLLTACEQDTPGQFTAKSSVHNQAVEATGADARTVWATYIHATNGEDYTCQVNADQLAKGRKAVEGVSVVEPKQGSNALWPGGFKAWPSADFTEVDLRTDTWARVADGGSMLRGRFVIDGKPQDWHQIPPADGQAYLPWSSTAPAKVGGTFAIQSEVVDANGTVLARHASPTFKVTKDAVQNGTPFPQAS